MGITRNVLPKKVRWLQRQWVCERVVRGPTCNPKEALVKALGERIFPAHGRRAVRGGFCPGKGWETAEGQLQDSLWAFLFS